MALFISAIMREQQRALALDSKHEESKARGAQVCAAGQPLCGNWVVTKDPKAVPPNVGKPPTVVTRATERVQRSFRLRLRGVAKVALLRGKMLGLGFRV